jgi:hypothetical protein
MRLVDANKFKGKVIASHCYSGVNKLINVDDIPTAYDVDKVVATMDKALIELEDGTNCGTCVFKEVCDDGYDGCIQTIVAVCKSIVKAGGNIELSEHSKSQGNRTGK